jgi:molybdate transport system substrate-binding protein
MSGGFVVAYQELLPEFEKTAGIKVSTTRGASQGDRPDTIGAQLRRGVPADVVIMNREGLEELIATGKIAAGTNVDLARVPLVCQCAPARRSPISATSPHLLKHCEARDPSPQAAVPLSTLKRSCFPG